VRALLDTDVLLSGAEIPAEYTELRVSSLTWAEIRAGIGKARGDGDGARARAWTAAYNRMRGAYGPGLVFDDACAAAFDQLVELTHAAGRLSRGRIIDLMIAATAVVHGADLVTANVDDYRGLESDLTVIPV
jgi:toxin FitB